METGRENPSTRRPGARLRLFLSYRRRSDSHSARLLKNELTRAFGEGTVFRDVDDIGPGAAFPEAIREAVESSDVFLLLVSPGWVELMGELRDPADFVRREIAAALARRVPLLPLLLGGARMPEADELPEEIRDLAFRQALEVSDGRWDYDVKRLVKLIRERPAPPAPSAPNSFLGTWRGRAAVVAAVAGIGWPVYLYTASDFGFDLAQSQAGCVRWLLSTHDVSFHEARVEAFADSQGTPIVWVDEYRRVSPPPPGGFPIVIKLTDSGHDIGEVYLKFMRGDYPKGGRVFKVLRVVEPPCVEVTDYANRDSNAKSEVYNWDSLSMRLGGRKYRLRLGDRGDSLLATLTREPER
jgi:hypothetical protein